MSLVPLHALSRLNRSMNPDCVLPRPGRVRVSTFRPIKRTASAVREAPNLIAHSSSYTFILKPQSHLYFHRKKKITIAADVRKE